MRQSTRSPVASYANGFGEVLPSRRTGGTWLTTDFEFDPALIVVVAHASASSASPLVWTSDFIKDIVVQPDCAGAASASACSPRSRDGYPRRAVRQAFRSR